MHNDVLFGIFLTLLSRESVTCEELAAKYELSSRTIYRYVDTLDMAGVPIMSKPGRSGGISIAQEYRLSAMVFTPEEYARIMTAVSNLEALEGTDGSLLDKIRAMAKQPDSDMTFSSDTLVIDSGGWGNTDSQRHKVKALGPGVFKSLVTEISYADEGGKASRRSIEPYTFLFKEGNWYLYAYCRMRGDFRVFKLSRISEIIVSKHEFIKKKIDLKSEPWNESFRRTVKTVTLTLSVSEEAALSVADWLGEGAVSGGRAVADVILSDSLISRLLSFGGGVRVISPVQVRDRLTEAAAGVLKIYDVQNLKDF